MNPDSERFVELASQPLAGNAELHLAATAELERVIGENVGERPEDLKEAADSLERADRHPRRNRWRIALYVITLVVSFPFLEHVAKQVVRASGLSFLFSPYYAAKVPNPLEIPNLSPQQKLLLSGDDRASSKSDRWKPLWESEPENPAYLAEYAAAYFSDHKELSPEILGAAERVDPDNGWFIALSAARTADGAVTREKRSAKEASEGKAAVITINDEARLQQTLALIHQLAGKPRFTSYQIELLRQRIPLFPPRVDFVSQIPLIAHVASINASSVPFRRFPDVLAAGARRCAEKGDVEGFRQIITDWHALVDLTCRNGGTLVDLLVAKVTLTGPAENFRDAARTLGLEEEARYFEKIDQRSKIEKKEKDRLRGVDRPVDQLFNRKGSLLGGLTGPLVGSQVQSPPPFTDDDMRPARYADYALFGRVFSSVGWFLPGLAAAVAAAGRYCQSPLTRGLSARMLDLLRRSDWAWIFLMAVVMPVLWYLFISRLTPLAAREWSVRLVLFIPAGGQFGALVASLIILPVVVSGHFLGKRGAVLGLAPRFARAGWLAAGSALAAVPAFGAIPAFDAILLEGAVGLAAFALAIFFMGIAVAWIFGGLIAGMVRRGSQSLRRATLARMVLPVAVAGMLVMALSIPFHYAEEKRWIRQDRLGEITADSPSLSHYEYLVTQILRDELLERLGKLPETR